MCLVFSSLSGSGEAEQLGAGAFGFSWQLWSRSRSRLCMKFPGAEQGWLSVLSLLRASSVGQ